MNYLFITSCRGGKMLQDSEEFKYYNKNGLYVCVDYKKSKSSCPKTLTYNENTEVAQVFGNHNHDSTKHASMNVVKAMIINAAANPDIPKSVSVWTVIECSMNEETLCRLVHSELLRNHQSHNLTRARTHAAAALGPEIVLP